jgi:hypothetical protein
VLQREGEGDKYMRKWGVKKAAFDNFIEKTRLGGGIHKKDREMGD